MHDFDVPLSLIGLYEKQTTSCHADVPAIIYLDADDGLFEQSPHQHHPIVTTTEQDHSISMVTVNKMY